MYEPGYFLHNIISIFLRPCSPTIIVLLNQGILSKLEELAELFLCKFQIPLCNHLLNSNLQNLLHK